MCFSQHYLGFFDQVQQVFDVMSEQILTLPHLIQSSERCREKRNKERMELETTFRRSCSSTTAKHFFLTVQQQIRLKMASPILLLLILCVQNEEDLLDSICVQGGIQVVKTLHSLSGFKVVRNHVLRKDPLHQQPVDKEGKFKENIG